MRLGRIGYINCYPVYGAIDRGVTPLAADGGRPAGAAVPRRLEGAAPLRPGAGGGGRSRRPGALAARGRAGDRRRGAAPGRATRLPPSLRPGGRVEALDRPPVRVRHVGRAPNGRPARRTRRPSHPARRPRLGARPPGPAGGGGGSRHRRRHHRLPRLPRRPRLCVDRQSPRRAHRFLPPTGRAGPGARWIAPVPAGGVTMIDRTTREFRSYVDLYERASLLELGRLADQARWRLHPENVVTYIIDRNINYTNVCVADCKFCAFYRRPKHGEGYVLSFQEIRDRVAKKKAGADRWLEVMETAHRLGLKTSVTMMYGLGETLADRVEHLFRVREVQAKRGGLTAFICWPLQPEHTELAHVEKTDAVTYLRTQAIARIVLDNVPNIQASWVTMGPKIGQVALTFGANDFGSLMMEENVVSAAGTTWRMTLPEMQRLIADAGYVPRQRRQDYSVIDEAA